MTILATTVDRVLLRRARVATAATFVLLGVVQGTIASRMPALKDAAGLSDGLLGLALLGVPLGSILAIQVTGGWIARRGSAPVTVVGAVLLSVTTALPALAGGFVTLTGALLLVGLGMGLTDAAMNAHAVTVEKAYQRPIMSSFHGFASLGALVGAAIGAAVAHAGVSTVLQLPVEAAVLLVLALVVRRSLLPGSADAHAVEASTSRVRTPWTRPLVLLAAVALLAWMTEHAIADWSAVYFRDRLGAGPGVAPYGYAAFAVCMVLTRFLADRVTVWLGPRALLRGGGLVAGVGLGLGLASGSVVGGVVGCALVGVGMAGIVPVVFTAAGNLTGVAAGSAVSRVAGVAYAGSLAGPPLIGVVADATSLRVALFLVAAAALVVAVLGPLAVRRAVPEQHPAHLDGVPHPAP